ncbi:MAG: autotransporter-associated beta strand repeat-containing protein [Pirellulales bacterium]
MHTNTLAGSVSTSATETTIYSTGGTLTFAGSLQFGGALTNFGSAAGTGAGNSIFAVGGTVSGSSGATVSKLGNSALLWNPTNTAAFLGSFSLTSGTMRVVSTTAGGNSIFGTRNGAIAAGMGAESVLSMSGGTLEIRIDNPTFAANTNVYQTTNSTYFADHAIGSTVLNGVVSLGAATFLPSTSSNILTFSSRNGYGFTLTSALAVGTAGGNGVTNSGNGLVTFNGDFWGNADTAAARTMTISGAGDILINGNVLANGGPSFDHILTKSGSGTLTITGTASTLDGPVNINGGTLTITDFRSLTNNTSTISIGTTSTAGVLSIGTGTAATLEGLTTSKPVALAGTNGGVTINANQSVAFPVVLNGAFSSGAGTKTLILGGTNTSDNLVNSAVVNNSAANITQLVKVGTGTWVLGATNTNTGATLITGGTLKLKSAAAGSTILVDTTAVGFGQDVATFFAGATLELVGAATVASNEVVGPLDLVSGANTIVVTPGSSGTATLRFASVGVSMATTAATSSTTVTVASTAGLVPGMIITGGTISTPVTIAAILSGTTFQTSASLAQANGVTLTFTRPSGVAVSGVTANGGGTVNFKPGTGSVIIGAVPSAGLLNAYSYFNGANFAYAPSTTNATLRSPTYDVDAGFVTVAASAARSAAANNRIGATSGTAGTVTQEAPIVLPTLKLDPNTTLVANALVTLQTAANSPGGILISGGEATISGTGGVSSGGTGDLVFRVDLAADKLTLSAPISGGTGGFTKTGAGLLVIAGINTQSGATTINEGTVQLSGTGVLSANSAAFVIRQGAVFDLNGLTTGTGATTTSIGSFTGSGTITNSSSGAATLVVGGGNGTGSFAGVIQNGVGVVSVTKNGTGGHTWSGLNTYTGITTINSTGVLSVVTLANLGSPSGIGAGSSTLGNAASLVFGGASATQSYGALNYTGSASVTFDRLFTFNGGADGGARIQNNSSVNAALVFNNTAALAFGSNAAGNAQGLVLGGSSTADNYFYPQVTNNGSTPTSLYKVDAGLWILGNSANNYSGPTVIGGGTLGLATMSALSSSSNLQFNGGILEASGSFSRTVGPGAGEVQWLAGASGGFSAGAGKLTVSLGGSPTWGIGEFVGSGVLTFNSATALSEVEMTSGFVVTAGPISTFTATTSSGGVTVSLTNGATTAGLYVGQIVSGNPNIPEGRWIATIASSTTFTLNSGTGVTAATSITTNFNPGAYRAISVADNSSAGTDFATISGVIQGSAGIQKVGVGTLQLFGNNTYTGSTRVTQGTLTVLKFGNSSEGPTGTSVGLAAGGNLSSQAVILDGGANLQYIGPGETSDRMIRIGSSGSAAIHADGSGPLVLTNVRNDMVTSANSLFLNGTSNAGNMITSTLTDNVGALQVVLNGGATWILTGNNTYTGTTDVLEGAFGFGSDQAAGVGQIRLMTSAAAGSFFAHGGDRQIANALHAQSSTASRLSSFYGDYSLTFNGNFTISSTTSGGHQLFNNIVAGKSLTFNGDVTFTEASVGTVALTLGGSGTTLLTGAISATSANKTVGVTYSGTGTATLAGSSSYAGVTQIIGAGTLVLSGGNSSTGTTTINNAAGTLQLAGAVNGGLASGLLTMTTGTLQAAGADRAISNAVTFTLGTISGSQNLTLNGVVTMSSGSNRVLTNNIVAGKLLTIAGNVFLSGSSTAGGGLTIAGSGDTTISGAVANFNGSGVSSSVVVTSSGVTTLSGANTYTNTTTMNTAAGTLVLSGSNNSAGATMLTAGTLQFNSSSNGGLASGLLTLTSGSVQALGQSRTVGNSVSLVSVTAIGTQNLTFSGTLSGAVGANRTLTNNISGAVLTLGNVNISGEAARTLTFDGSGRTIVTGVVASGHSNKANQLIKLGSGVLTLSGNLTHDYTGNTTIGGGTLNGTGTLTSRVVVQAGGTLSPGNDTDGVDNNGVGKLTVAGSQWDSGAAFVFDFAAGDDGSTTNVTNWDLLNIVGTGLTLADGTGIYTLSIRSWTSATGEYGVAPGFDAASNYRWLWVDNAGTLADGVLGQFTINTAGFYGPSGPAFVGGSFWVSSVNSDLYVNYQAVPEPGSMTLISVAALSFFRLRRKKLRRTKRLIGEKRSF